MKSLLLFLFFITVSINVQCQIQTDTINGFLRYRHIQEVDLTQEQIWKETEKWMAVTFKDSKEVIRLSNEENLIGKGTFTENVKVNKYSIPTQFKFTIDIAFKEGRYKFEIYDLEQTNSAIAYSVPVLYFPNLNKSNYFEIAIKGLKYIPDATMQAQTLRYLEKNKVKDKDIQLSIEASKELFSIIENNLSIISNSLLNHLTNSKEGW